MQIERRQTSAGQGLSRAFLQLTFLALFSGQLVAAESELSVRSRWVQGAPIFGSLAPGSTVKLGDRTVEVSSSGKFVLGLAYDTTGPVSLEIGLPDGAIELHEFEIEQRDYQTQKISGLPRAMVTPPESVLKRIQDDRSRVVEARSHFARNDDSFDAFDWPVTGRITGEFGAARVLNGVPRQPHFGIDMAAAEGTPIQAPAGGVVRMADADLYYTGGTIILDHGFGLTTTYLHLSQLAVETGEVVTKGQIIGKLGQTGRATGPHLCWRANWFDVRVDPSLLVRDHAIRKGERAK